MRTEGTKELRMADRGLRIEAAPQSAIGNRQWAVFPQSEICNPQSVIFTFLLALLLLCPFALAKDADFEQAESLRYKRKPDEALILYEKVLARPNLGAEEKVRCRAGIIDCLRQQKKVDEALAQAKSLHEALPAEHWMKRQMAGTVCDLLSQLERFDQAAALAVQVAEGARDEPETAADWHLRCAQIHLRARKYAQAYEQAGKAAEVSKETEDHRRVLESLWQQSEAMYTAKEFERCLVPLRAALELRYDDLPFGSWLRFKQRIAECWTKLDKPDQFRSAYHGFIKDEQDAAQRQRWWLGIARSWEAEKNAAEAVKAYEQVIIDHPESACRDFWAEAQGSILRLTLLGEDDNASLQMMRLAFDLADSRDRMQSISTQILAMIRKIDGHPVRARSFIAYQQHGPNGPDENPDTSDDLLNPLERVGYPSNPARVAAFEAASAKLGCDAQASLHRGWMCMYIGRPREAVTWFLDACRRASGDEYQAAVHALLFCGVKGANESIGDVERYADFILNGPNPDGNAHRPDPFKAIAAEPALASNSMTDVQRATLKDVARRLSAGLEQELWQADMRADVIAALERIHGGLGDWDTAGLADWYLARMKNEPTSKTQEVMLPSALSAARAQQAHMAAMRQFLARLDGAEGTQPILRETVRKAWAVWIARIEKETRSKTLVPRMRVI